MDAWSILSWIKSDRFMNGGRVDRATNLCCTAGMRACGHAGTAARVLGVAPWVNDESQASFALQHNSGPALSVSLTRSQQGELSDESGSHSHRQTSYEDRQHV